MNAEITKIEAKKSKHGGVFYYVFFRGENRSYRTCIYPNMRNYRNWAGLLEVGNVLYNLKLKDDFLVDADSKPHLVVEGTQ